MPGKLGSVPLGRRKSVPGRPASKQHGRSRQRDIRGPPATARVRDCARLPTSQPNLWSRKWTNWNSYSHNEPAVRCDWKEIFIRAPAWQVRIPQCVPPPKDYRMPRQRRSVLIQGGSAVRNTAHHSSTAHHRHSQSSGYDAQELMGWWACTGRIACIAPFLYEASVRVTRSSEERCDAALQWRRCPCARAFSGMRTCQAAAVGVRCAKCTCSLHVAAKHQN